MKKKVSKKIAGGIAAIILALLTAYVDKTPSSSEPQTSSPINSQLIYTRHAKCRMKCRFISATEVEEVLKTGSVNSKKSKPLAQPCPVVAKEKRTADGQRARVVYANCPQKIKIITVIDLGKKYDCYCK